MPRVISVLHHPLASLEPGRLAEEENNGWHFRSAKALAKYSGYTTVAVRPGSSSEWISKFIDGVLTVIVPSIDLPPGKKFRGRIAISPALARVVRGFVERLDFIPYIHEYRALNSELVARVLIDHPMILQHHGSRPPGGLTLGDPIVSVKELNRFRREAFLRKVKGVFFVLNRYEEYYLRSILGVDAEVRIRTMCVDFDEIKPLSPVEKLAVKRSLGLRGDEILITTYMGVFGEEFSSLKGAHYIPRIWRALRNRFSDRIRMVVTGVGEPYAAVLRRAGIIACRRLPHRDFIKVAGASDIYFLPATSGYRYGGISVAIMEAMALGIPIISPTLKEFPEPEGIRDIGIATKWVDDESSLSRFIDDLIYLIENKDSYRPWVIRELGMKYYSWQVFTRDFREALGKL
ncbi:glycosyltransferase [Desulfurococcus amylolyticus]|uniref:glycosyltransferase n=1 Tax=Desulfurococcus amylolyticus TaxID=94694 RepID=UPI0005B1E92D|nr:glycosyltransferase [Desulfurococcus amylolyticus]